MKRLNPLFLLLPALQLASCFREELPVPAKDRGPVITGNVSVGHLYEQQVYYSIEKNSTVLTVSKYDWHLAFSGDRNNPYVMMNTSLGMYAGETEHGNLNQPYDTAGLWSRELYDEPSGHPDSLALSNILTNNKIYIIHLGKNAGLQSEGYAMIKVGVNGMQYVLEISGMNGSGYRQITVPFNDSVNRILCNVKSGNHIAEPPYKSWDLLFTQYTHLYQNPFQTYSVVGCLINEKKMKAAMAKSGKSFETIVASDTAGIQFSSDRDIIGFGWKYFDLNNNVYIIRSARTYFIRFHEGIYYKLHFISYYDNLGNRGYPVFEYRKL